MAERSIEEFLDIKEETSSGKGKEERLVKVCCVSNSILFQFDSYTTKGDLKRSTSMVSSDL